MADCIEHGGFYIVAGNCFRAAESGCLIKMSSAGGTPALRSGAVMANPEGLKLATSHWPLLLDFRGDFNFRSVVGFHVVVQDLKELFDDSVAL